MGFGVQGTTTLLIEDQLPPSQYRQGIPGTLGFGWSILSSETSLKSSRQSFRSPCEPLTKQKTLFDRDPLLRVYIT